MNIEVDFIIKRFTDIFSSSVRKMSIKIFSVNKRLFLVDTFFADFPIRFDLFRKFRDVLYHQSDQFPLPFQTERKFFR